MAHLSPNIIETMKTPFKATISATCIIYGPRQANLVLIIMRAAKVQASLRIRAVLPEPPLLAHTSSESRGTFRQKARSLAPLNGWACAVKICHDGMLEDTNSLDAVQLCTGIHILSYMVKSGTSARNIAVTTIRPVAGQDSSSEITLFFSETF